MVRAGAVAHPREWSWCGFRELVGDRKRYRLVDRARLLERSGASGEQEFVANYSQVIEEALARREFAREPMWTESIAVGSGAFVKAVSDRTQHRVALEMQEPQPGVWVVRETGLAYA